MIAITHMLRFQLRWYIILQNLAILYIIIKTSFSTALVKLGMVLFESIVQVYGYKLLIIFICLLCVGFFVLFAEFLSDELEFWWQGLLEVGLDLLDFLLVSDFISMDENLLGFYLKLREGGFFFWFWLFLKLSSWLLPISHDLFQICIRQVDTRGFSIVRTNILFVSFDVVHILYCLNSNRHIFYLLSH